GDALPAGGRKRVSRYCPFDPPAPTFPDLGRGTTTLLILIPHADPVVPIRDRLLGLLIRACGGPQLCEGYRQAVLVPPNGDKDLAPALRLRRHAEDLDFIFDLQGGHGALGDAGSRERELQLTVEVIVPTHRAFVPV